MNRLKILAVAFLTFSAASAQDLQQAKKAIDAEQYEKAKGMLKSITQSSPDNGEATLLLGNIYLQQQIADSAKIYFQKGITASDKGYLNYIGLGQLDLNAGNVAAAQANFNMATKNVKRKDTDAYIYIAQAYMNADKPNYANAISILDKAKLANDKDPLVQLELGNAQYGSKNQNEAYVAYRNAVSTDNSLIRAKMQQGVLLKGARSFSEALKAFDLVIAANPNYGPVYRELAETYYIWGNAEPAKYEEYLKKALGYYEKYMSLTDYSLTSRMRHADFLILAKDYAALEVEAQKMKELDKVNPRILRYLGYSAYENGNTDVALKSLQDFIANPSSKIIARDYLYLGLAKLKKANTVEGTLDTAMFDQAVADIKKAVEMESEMTNDLSEVGKGFYEKKMYKEAALIYEIAASNPKSKNNLLDNFYLGNAIYFDNARKELKDRDMEALKKADIAYGNVITGSPATFDAYIFRARVSSLMDNDEQLIKYYEDYVRAVSEKGPEEMAKNKSKIVESYNNIGAAYANTDAAKAREFFGKTLAIDPENKYATESMKSLK